jgi:hypothetical protein
MNGENKLNTNSYISLGLVPLIVSATAWILIAINGASGKADKAADVAGQTKELVNSLTSRVEGIDAGGTRGERQVTDANTQRIAKLEETTSKLVPDVAEIKTNLGWIADWVKMQKKDSK